MDITVQLGAVVGFIMMAVGSIGSCIICGTGAGLEAMMRIMDTVGVDKWEDLEGKYVQCVLNDGWGGPITKIGNITKDKWFDLKEFFKNVQEERAVKEGKEPHEYNNAEVNHFKLFKGEK